MNRRHEFHGLGWILSYAVLFSKAIKNTSESKICRKFFFSTVLFIYLFFLTLTDIQSRMRPVSECVNQFLQCLYIYSEVK